MQNLHLAFQIVVSPLNLLSGLVALFVCSLLTHWRRTLTAFDWLFALFLNIPLIASMSELVKGGPNARPSTLMIFTVLGAGGIGLGWIVGLLSFQLRRGS